MNFDPVAAFLQEAEELIAEIEQSALALEANEAPAEAINALFRAFHTIQGSGAMAGLDHVAHFTHGVENLLDRVRGGSVPYSEQLVEVILKATDHVRLLLAVEQGGAPVPSGAGEALTAKIAELGSSAPPPAVEPAAPAGAVVAEGPEQIWRICFHPHPAMLSNGANAVALLNELRRLGSCEVIAHTDGVPALDAMQPDVCYLWWTISVGTAADENAIRDVFIFVEDGASLEIERAAGTPRAATETKAAPESPHRKPAVKEATVRVPAEKLDRLVNLVGELVMNHSCLAQAARQTSAPEFINPVQVLERLVAQLRDDVLGIRMLPIGSLFGRFRRVVHDLSAELGKEAELVTEGEETELDKSVLDQLGDPLVHCLRNSLDHGVEPAAERVAKGKPPRATIRLTAEHTGSNVVIGIEDDGRGINRTAVRARAVENHLIAPDAALSDEDILNLIARPGFSTAHEITSVSGRGVGMDVVRRQIDSLRGSIALSSTEGKGTRVSITLPLTLAIIEGLLVEVGGDQFIMPMAAVTENVELTAEEKDRFAARRAIAVRGQLMPWIDLRELFHIGGKPPRVEKMVIVQHGGDRAGLLVDRVVGTHQTVLQSLGRFFKNTQVVSGASIMGDGRVALIVDVAAIVRSLDRRCRAPEGSTPAAGNQEIRKEER